MQEMAYIHFLSKPISSFSAQTACLANDLFFFPFWIQGLYKSPDDSFNPKALMIFLRPLHISSYWLKIRHTLSSPLCLSKSWNVAVTAFITFLIVTVIIHLYHFHVISIILESPP